MSTFLVTGLGHSGTAYLARQLGKAAGWQVEHEPEPRTYAAWWAKERYRLANLEQRNYGEVNSYLLAAALDVGTGFTQCGVLLRNPYNVLASIAKPGEEEWSTIYVREGLAHIDCLLVRGFMPIRFRGITTDPLAVLSAAIRLGIHTLVPEDVRVDEVVNRHPRVPGVRIGLDDVARREFDTFIFRHDLEEREPVADAICV